MRRFWQLFVLATMLVVAVACSAAQATDEPTPTPVPTAIKLLVPPTPTPLVAGESVTGTQPLKVTPSSVTTSAGEVPLYQDPSQPVEKRVDDLLARMTLEEKIGQMTQVEHNSLQPANVTRYVVGSVLSGGGSIGDNSVEAWRKLVTGYEQAALETRLGIPLIYGIDAVHGDGHLSDGTIFPHNIGLGATRDAALVEKVGRVTAEEVAATGVQWNFAPVVAVPQDTRWGRTYEGYSENTDLVAQLGAADVRGLQGATLTDSWSVLATPKHFIGDGGTTWGTSHQNIMDHPYLLDQGNTQVDEATLRAKFLPPYQAAIDAGAKSIMVSFSSWNGIKMHAQQYLLTDVLKRELGFKGFLISDWGAVDQLPGDYTAQVATAINAGLDMIMVPDKYQQFIDTLTAVAKDGRVPLARIDEAVRRILTTKFELGLFEHPLPDEQAMASVGSEEHRAVAREAVRRSLVLLKNENHALPIARDTSVIFVAGQAAEDIGLQSGGWTIEWQGREGQIAEGTTILEGIKQIVGPQTRVVYDRYALFDNQKGAQGSPLQADVGIVVVAEKPYAEGVGDKADPKLSATDTAVIENMRERSQKVIVIVMSGRPIEITGQLLLANAWVVAWLPGTEGNGVSDMLFGDYEFTGKLPYTWQRWNKQLPFDFKNLPKGGCDAPLFPYGYGLTTKDLSPQIPDCPKP